MENNTEFWWEEKNPSFDWQGLYDAFPQINFEEVYDMIPDEILNATVEDFKDVR